MKDILGRELKTGDIVVCMAIGRDSKGMFLGIQTDTGSIRTLDGCKNPSNRFLVVNPSPDELEIANKIKVIMENEKYDATSKSIPYRDLKFCHIYEDKKGKQYLYLGYCEVVCEVHNKFKNEYCGYIYIPVEDIRYFTEPSTGPYTGLAVLRYSSCFIVRSKNSKIRFVKYIGECDSILPYVNGSTISRSEYVDDLYGPYKVQITCTFNRLD